MTLSAPDHVRHQFLLGPHEEQLWAGRPGTGLLPRRGSAVAIALTLIVALSAVLWDAPVLRGGAPFSTGLFADVLLVPAAVGGLFVDARRRARTIYAVTSERIIINGGLSLRKTTSRALATLTDISLKEEADGSGTINFGPRGLAAIFASAKWPLPTFEFIPEARRVYSIILEARRAALASRSSL